MKTKGTIITQLLILTPSNKGRRILGGRKTKEFNDLYGLGIFYFLKHF